MSNKKEKANLSNLFLNFSIFCIQTTKYFFNDIKQSIASSELKKTADCLFKREISHNTFESIHHKIHKNKRKYS